MCVCVCVCVFVCVYIAFSSYMPPSCLHTTVLFMIYKAFETSDEGKEYLKKLTQVRKSNASLG